MPAIFTLAGLIFTVFGFRLLRLPRTQRTRISLVSAIIICTTGIFILISGITLLILSQS